MKRIVTFICCLAICTAVLFKERIREGPFFHSISSFFHFLNEVEHSQSLAYSRQPETVRPMGFAHLLHQREPDSAALIYFKKIASAIGTNHVSSALVSEFFPQLEWNGALLSRLGEVAHQVWTNSLQAAPAEELLAIAPTERVEDGTLDYFRKAASAVGTNHASSALASEPFPQLEWNGALLNRLGEVAHQVWANSLQAAPAEELLAIAPTERVENGTLDYFRKAVSAVGTNHASSALAPQPFPRMEWNGVLLDRLGEVAREVWANSFQAALAEQLLAIAPTERVEDGSLDYFRKAASALGTNHASSALVSQPFPRLEWNGALLDRLGEVAHEMWTNDLQIASEEQILAVAPEDILPESVENESVAKTAVSDLPSPILDQALVNNSDNISKLEAPQLRRVNPYPIPKRIDMSHIEGKGIGYDVGYTKLAVIFGPEYQMGKFLPLGSVSGQVFDDGKAAASVGFIGRFLPSSLCEIFGFNISYDFRQSRIGNFNQVSGGVEVLNKRWEVHANAYVPFGRRIHTQKTVFDDYIGDYRAVRYENEYATYSVDAKAGYYVINGKSFQLYLSAGPYYLFGPFRTSILGGKAMVRPQYKDWLYVELSVSHDRVLETIYQVNVIFSIPLYRLSSGMKNKKGPCGMSKRQIYQPVDPDIVLRKKCCWHANFGQTCME